MIPIPVFIDKIILLQFLKVFKMSLIPPCDVKKIINLVVSYKRSSILTHIFPQEQVAPNKNVQKF